MGNFSHLPTDILLDIITRLPIESILECKPVCKPWRNLVSHHQSFSRLHLTHLNHSPDPGKLSFLLLAENEQLYYLEYTENHNQAPIHSIRRFNFTPPFTSPAPFIPPSYKVIGSFNGLVCIFGYGDDVTCICNPVTREHVMLPKIKRDCDDDQYFHRSSGFGYDSLTSEYKVVEICEFKREPDCIEVAVYTLGSGKGWRNVGRFDYKICKYFSSHGVFVNGALYWVDKRDGRLLGFDLTVEKFREPLSPPPSVLLRVLWSGTIGELGGVLYYVTRHDGEVTSDANTVGCFDIWVLEKKNDIRVMKEQGEHAEALGWRKVFSLLERQPLAFTKSGVVLCFDHTSLGVYDPEAKTSNGLVDFTHFSTFSQIFHHKNTLVSMKELGEGDIKIMESVEPNRQKTAI